MASEPTDEALMQRVARGDQRALEALCARWQRRLHGLLWRQTAGRDVEDLYQETWLRVVRAADRFDPQRRFSTWLHQIALNLCRDWRRRPPEEPVDPDRIRLVAPDATAATSAAVDVERLLAALPEAQRSVVALRLQQDLSEAQVAEILGIPRGTVKSRLHEALRRLAALARGEQDVTRDL